MSKQLISGYQIYHGFMSGYMNIARHREYLNRINVFPVADGDTGSNMIGTLRSIINNLKSSHSPKKTLNHIADLSMESSRGNSGIILSQYLNSLAKNAEDMDLFTVKNFGIAVKKSVDDAYSAMESPQEGTILTVIKVWADKIFAESMADTSFPDVLSRGLESARKALAETPLQLEILKRNNVVDAGAWGFVSFLEGIEQLQQEGPVPSHIRKTFKNQDAVFQEHSGHSDNIHLEKIDFRYCTEALVENPSVGPKQIKILLQALGDSLIVNQGRDKTRVHIHTNNPEKIIGILKIYGRISQQKVDDMKRQADAVNNSSATTGILTDSIADISLEILDKYNINVLNLKLRWDNEEFIDRLTIHPKEFYHQQGIRTSFPESSVPERTQVDSTYQFLTEHYKNLLVLPVAKALSGTWQQMKLAAEPFNNDTEQIAVVDTCLNSVAQGLLVVEIAKAAKEGRTLTELKQMAENLKKKTKIFVSVQTFKYMVKGGRVSPLTGFIAKALNLKPIVSLDNDGRGIAFDKSFSQKGLMRKIEKLIQETTNLKGISSYAVVHAAAPERAAEFAQIVEKITGKPPSYITSISPIVGMHSGKGAVAIGIIEGS